MILKVKVILKFFIALLVILFPFYSLLAESHLPLKIGVIFPFTGKEARQGELGKVGIALALQELADFQPEVVYEDSQSETGRAVAAFHKLSSVDRVDAVLTMGSPTAMALLPLANKSQISLLAIAVVSEFSMPNDYGFRLMASAAGFSSKIMDLLEKDLAKKRIALIFVEDDYGSAYEKILRHALGSKLVTTQGFLPAMSDFRTLLLKTRGFAPEAIILATRGVEAGMLLRQAREVGLTSPVFVCPGACDNPDVAVTGAGATDPLIIIASASKTTPARIRILQENFHQLPTSVVLRSFDVITVLRRAFAECQTTASNRRECIKKSLTDGRDIPGSSYPINFDSNGDILDRYDLKVVRDGKLVIARIDERRVVAE
jgi:branched-chain amino acid transport system substrate-binding protein